MQLITTLLFLYLFFSFTLHAQSTPNIEKIINSELSHYIQAGEPGCSVVYGKNGKNYYSSKGLENITTSDKLSENSRFLTASVSKQFTAHIAMLLAENGRLDVTKKLKELLHDFPMAEEFNALQLMNHTSGIPDHWAIFEMQGKALSDLYYQESALELIRMNDQLEFKPGSQFSYSNGGYVLLTELIERVTNKTLNQNINQLIFEALGIQAKYLDNDKSDTKSLVNGHVKTDEGGFEYRQYKSYIYGPGNLMITAKEFALWADYLNAYLLASPSEQNQLNGSMSHFNYQAGLYVERDANDVLFYHHGGYYEHATQDIVLVPNTKEFVVALCNRSDFRPAKITRNILKKLQSLEFAEITQVNSTANNSIQAGYYANTEGTKSALIYNENDTLYYYGSLVGSPKPLVKLSNELWGIKLSASKIFIKFIDENTLRISNEQNDYEVHFSPIDPLRQEAIGTFNYANKIIGEVEISLGDQSYINFPSGLGKLLLTCSANGLCFSEYGYLLLNIGDLTQPVLSTHHLQNIRLSLKKG